MVPSQTPINEFEVPLDSAQEEGRDEQVAHTKEWGVPEMELTGLIPPHVAVSSEVTLMPPLPMEISLGALRDGRLRVVRPIAVTLQTENDDVIAEARDLNEFGFGKNWSLAMADLQKAIAELFFSLERDRERLGPDLQRTRAVLRKLVERVPIRG